MASYLRDSFGFKGTSTLASSRFKTIKLHIHDGSLLSLEHLDGIYPEANSFIFLSKHKSDSGIPTLTCHCTGNFAGNPYGGNQKEIAISFPSLQKEYLKAITAGRQKVQGYDVILEATHHGPTSLKKPVLFMELGSTEKQWADKNAAGFMCDSLLCILDKGIGRCKYVGVALGGTHYSLKFNKILLDSEFGLAAVASKHNLEAIDEGMLGQMIEKSIERVTHIIVDSKGLGIHKERITKMSEKTGLEILKV
jgi:D-aminoacyl-tRNA deacylase